MNNIPDFTKFKMPIIKRTSKKLISEELCSSPEDTIEMLADVIRHAAEVINELKDCKCNKCTK